MLCPGMISMCKLAYESTWPTVSTFHNRIVLSSDPDAMVAPSGLHEMVEMPARWPSKVWISLPLRVSQTLTAASAPNGAQISNCTIGKQKIK